MLIPNIEYEIKRFISAEPAAGVLAAIDGGGVVRNLIAWDPASGDVSYSAPAGTGANTRIHRFDRPLAIVNGDVTVTSSFGLAVAGTRRLAAHTTGVDVFGAFAVTGGAQLLGSAYVVGAPVMRVESTGSAPIAGAGVGMEIWKDGIQSYNRTTAAYGIMTIAASVVNLTQGPIAVLAGTSSFQALTATTIAATTIDSTGSFIRLSNDVGFFHLRNSATASVGGLTSHKGWTGSGSTTDLALFSAGIVEVYAGNNSSASLTIAASHLVSFTGDMQLANGKFLKGTRSSGSLVHPLIGNEAGTDRVLLMATGDWVLQDGGLNNNLVITTAGAGTFRASVTATQLIITTNTSPSAGGQWGYSTSGGSYIWGKAGSATDFVLFNGAGQTILSVPTGTTSARFDGALGVGVTPGYRLHVVHTVSDVVASLQNAHAASPYGVEVFFTAAAPNNASQYFLWMHDNAATRCLIYTNGGIHNYQANNVNLSDARLKTSIRPLVSWWDRWKRIEFVEFKYRDQSHDDFNIGVIAQQLRGVAPQLVDETRGRGRMLAVYTADLYHAMGAVVQETQGRVEQAETRITALERTIADRQN